MIQRYAAAVANPSMGNMPGKDTVGLCEICRNPGHDPHHCPLLQKYKNTATVVHCDLYRVNTHRTEDCHALDTLAERLSNNLFAIESTGATNRAQNQNQGKRALGNDANCPPPGCYNLNEVGHIARNCS